MKLSSPKTLFFALTLVVNTAFAQEKAETSEAKPINIEKQLKGFDDYANKLLKDWNCPGIGVGVVYKGKLVFAKGYGYRDYGKKLPVTPNTLFQIASNTKLFTAVSAGMLVDDGKLSWDKPIKNDVPTLNFYNNDLNNTVTLQDMLGHRTGISRHDMVWFKSNITGKQIFDKIKYLEPSAPLRTKFLYNNLLFSTIGQIISQKSGKSYEAFVHENILNPLQMTTSTFEEAAMRKTGDFVVPYNEKRDSDILYEIPIYFDGEGLNPAGGLMSNINDISHWLMALMNDGKYNGKQVIPSDVLKATLEPGLSLPNSPKYNEILNANYGLARMSVPYRGHLLLMHGGDLNGIHSQISMMPKDNIGVVVFVIGDQSAVLYNTITSNVYERLLGLSQTPWSERLLKDHIDAKKADKEARSKATNSQIPNTKPSHPIADYLGDFSNEPYGTITISQKDKDLQFKLNNLILPLHHYHYDRFDTDNDENLGQYSINYRTNPQGDIDGFTISLDEGEVFFNKKVDANFSNPQKLKIYEGKYESAGTIVTVALKNDQLTISIPGQPDYQLVPYKENEFKLKEFSDIKVVFKLENGKVTSVTQVSSTGEFELKKKE
ncbi:CubicO group peptidase, beta-lactamase class C family [Soonwooa buanensis]|uniref:CubicO group peptidase, beta-lactamase class C family n=1 Tax=Soonwooa buanensis TaxID=619805 RepID=A0A1T5E5A2_9FLAO|nr:serine hydrolase [Soonwooa buanensis]SKB78983.1 CubicO group peptidase, beta-lactamase class C family [Soonwooa buanensis]